jgi:RNA polymerase sigma factor (sigma-70 family)
VLVTADSDRAPAGARRQTGDIDEGDAGDAGGEFAVLYQLQYPRLVRSLEVAGLARAAAEDVAQEAFARTLLHWRRVRRGSSPAGYVYRVAFRLSKRSRRSDAPLDEQVVARLDAGVSGDPASMVTLRTAVDGVLATMPASRRACAVLCFVAGLSPKEAGRALGIAESTVRKQLERARRDLRSALVL